MVPLRPLERLSDPLATMVFRIFSPTFDQIFPFGAGESPIDTPLPFVRVRGSVSVYFPKKITIY
jgi:hypothetical protein